MTAASLRRAPGGVRTAGEAPRAAARGRRPGDRRRRPRALRSPAPARRRGLPPTAGRGCRRRPPARRRGSREAARRAADPRSTRTCRRARRRWRPRRGCCPAPRSRCRSGAPPSRCTRRRCTTRDAPSPSTIAELALGPVRRRRRSGAQRPPRAESPSRSSARPSGPYRGFAHDCVAIAPTSGSAQGTTQPTARNFDCTATPHCRASRSQAQMEYVATTGLAVGHLREVEREQRLVGDERTGDRAERQRARAPPRPWST